MDGEILEKDRPTVNADGSSGRFRVINKGRSNVLHKTLACEASDVIQNKLTQLDFRPSC